jgi:hypothetical protein
MPTHQAHPDPSFSLLLSLPRELRDRVYTYALVSQTPLLWPVTAPESIYSKHRNVSVNLLRTSKQVHDEAVNILYAQNKFLFTHPSDCNIFRVVTSKASVNITSVYFRIKDKDLALWTAYMGSRKEERSLRGDLPKLKNLWVFLRLAMCPHFMSSVLAGTRPGAQAAVGGGVQAVQTAMGHQINALQQQVQNAINQVITNAGVQIVGGTGGHAHAPVNANQIPPPPPPAPAMPFPQFMQGALGLGGHAQHHQAIPVPHAHGQHNHPPNPSPLAQHLQAQQNNPTVQVIPAPTQQTPPATSPADMDDANRLYSSLIHSNRFKIVESLCLQLRDTLHPKTSHPPQPSKPSLSTPIPRERSNRPMNVPPARFSAHDDSGKPPIPSATAKSELPPPPGTDVKIVCIVRPGKRQIERLLATFPEELEVDPITQDARTRFKKIHGVEVSWEFNGLADVEAGRAGDVIVPWDGGW